MVQVIVKKKTPKPFKGSDGTLKDYCWYRAERTTDGVTLEFGSTKMDYAVGETVSVELIKHELAGGRYRYTEEIQK